MYIHIAELEDDFLLHSINYFSVRGCFHSWGENSAHHSAFLPVCSSCFVLSLQGLDLFLEILTDQWTFLRKYLSNALMPLPPLEYLTPLTPINICLLLVDNIVQNRVWCGKRIEETLAGERWQSRNVCARPSDGDFCRQMVGAQGGWGPLLPGQKSLLRNLQ